MVSSAALAVALVVMLNGAPAMAGEPARSSAAPHVLAVAGSAAEATALEACPVYRYGYWGKMKCGSIGLDCDFNFDGNDDESWVVADDRTIWHVWPGSGRWLEMPNRGRADHIFDCYTSGNGHRVVEVLAGSSVWYSWRGYDGVWHGWYRA